MDSQDHPSETVFPIQSSMRLSGLPQRIACRDRHPNPVLSEVTVQLLEFTRTRDGIEGTHAERGPLVGNRIDPVRVDDAALGPQEVETPLELLASGKRKHAIQSVGRELPELLE